MGEQAACALPTNGSIFDISTFCTPPLPPPNPAMILGIHRLEQGLQWSPSGRAEWQLSITLDPISLGLTSTTEKRKCLAEDSPA